jgi:hypothetical protein
MHDIGIALHAVAARTFGAHDFSMHVAICGRQPVSSLQPSSLTPRHARKTSHAVASCAFA